MKIVLEKHADGYVAYPLGSNGVIVGQGDSYEGALADVRSVFASTSRQSGRMRSIRNRRYLKRV